MAKARPLSPKQQLFVTEYLIDMNAAGAARRAGYSGKSAEDIGRQLLRKTPVAEAIAEARNRVAEKLEISHEQIVARLWSIATANPNELVAHRIGACRYCHGVEHEFQWKTAREFDAACQAASEKDEAGRQPTDHGGYGYDITAAPAPDCPECNGLGIGYVHAADTAALRGAAALLYDGVKQTREGIEIKLQDRAKALEQVARHLGFFNDKLTLKGDAENPLTLLIAQLGKSALPVVAEPPIEDEEDR